MAKWQIFLTAAVLAVTAGASATLDTADAQRRSRNAVQAVDPNGPYTDEQLRTYIAIEGELGALPRGTTTEEQNAYTRQAAEILQRHNMGPVVYNTIAERSRTDQELAARLANIRTADLTDETLTHFVAAVAEIAPISQALSAGEIQSADASTQIAAILQRHSIDAQTYNAIVARAQTDTQLADRITALQTPPTAEGAAAGPSAGNDPA